jgi:hypothetical protein
MLGGGIGCLLVAVSSTKFEYVLNFEFSSHGTLYVALRDGQ